MEVLAGSLHQKAAADAAGRGRRFRVQGLELGVQV